MRNLLFFVCALAIPFLSAIDKKLTNQFELLVQESPGVLTDFPEEVRDLRRGPVAQKVLFNDLGEITIQLTFPCSQDDGTVAGAQFSRTIHLADLQANQGTVVLNEHLNTITFKGAGGTCSLAFSSIQKACYAKKILDKLIDKTTPVQEKEEFQASDLAKKAEFTYLVIAPRNEDLSEAVRGVFMNGTSTQNVVWLTKKNLKDIEGIVREGCNCLPIFVYDLSVLDKAPFYTTSIPGSTSLTYVTFKDISQSVASNDEQGLRRFFSTNPFAGIRFKGDPCLKKPVCVICKKYEKTAIRKASTERHVKIPEEAFNIFPGLFSSDDAPLGTTTYWLTGINNNSYEVLAYCLQNEQITHNIFSGVLYREFPHLRPLLKGGSRYAKNLTREQAICRSLKQLSLLKSALRPDVYAVLQVAFFTCELGAPFGSDNDIGYNTWPFAQAIAEKVGLSGLQELLLEFLVRENSSLMLNKHEKDQAPIDTWHCLAKKAGILNVPAEDLWMLKKTFASILLCGDEKHSPRLRALSKVHKSFKNILCFGVPFGLKSYRGPYPLRTLYSSYIWEVRDNKHRDGLVLCRKRAKFEAMMLQGSKTISKTSFWDWLDRGTELSSTTYVSGENREEYRAIFENGRLVHPAKFADCEQCELLFVIDEWGRIYVGLKEDAKDLTKCNFNHASIFNGKPVASAGKLVLEHGRPVELLDHSGHYRPSIQQTGIAVRSLAEHGVDIEHLVVSMKIEKRKWNSGHDFLRFAEG